MKTICPPGYHHNGFVATHELGHMMHGLTVHHVHKCMSCHKTIVVITGRAHLGNLSMNGHTPHASKMIASL